MALFGKKEKEELTLPEVLPQHVGFIMDGNSRWAKKRGLPRSFGHREGAKNFKKIVRYCKDIGLKNISFYAFSTENWQRPADEVNTIMELFRDYIADVRNFLSENTRMIFLGDKSAFDQDLQEKMIKLEEDTAKYDEMTLMMAVNYGGRDELAHAARILAQQAADGKILSLTTFIPPVSRTLILLSVPAASSACPTTLSGSALMRSITSRTFSGRTLLLLSLTRL